jgi:2-keto-3-deoxy-L-rhamnonate aldolase RhmA
VEDGQTKVGGELRVMTVGGNDCLVKDVRQYKWIEQFLLMSQIKHLQTTHRENILTITHKNILTISKKLDVGLQTTK